MMDKETADKLRGMIRRVTIKSVNDGGETQSASIEVADGIFRDDIEILQPFGIGSNPPKDGAMGIVLALGGDEGDMVVLPAANPSKRMGGLAPGEVGLSTEHGDKIVLGAGGTLVMKFGGLVTIKTGGNVEIEAAEVTITAGTIRLDGNVIVDGTLHATGDITSDQPDGADE